MQCEAQRACQISIGRNCDRINEFLLARPVILFTDAAILITVYLLWVGKEGAGPWLHKPMP
jgi:hypothetical protein